VNETDEVTYQAQVGDTEAVLLELREKIEQAGTLPLSSSPRVNRDEVLAELDDALHTLPLEIREARWILKERDEVIARAHKEAGEIIEAARERAARMVERTEVVRDARRAGDRIVTEAEDRARVLRLEAEDYVDQKLAAFEVVLDRTMQAVQKGREKLQVHVGSPALADVSIEAEVVENDFFDQDTVAG
jgi:hypothetical protein